MWFYAGLGVVGLLVVRQLWRLSDKLCDFLFAKISTHFRKRKEFLHQERQRVIKELRDDPDKRRDWQFQEIRVRLKANAKLIGGVVLTLLGPSSTFLLVVGFGNSHSQTPRIIFFCLGGLTAEGLNLLVDGWTDWLLIAFKMRSIYREAVEVPKQGLAEVRS